jgi:cytochrome c556
MNSAGHVAANCYYPALHANNRRNRRMKQIAIATAVLMAALTSANAEEPENYIKYRQAMMKAIGGHMAASAQIVRGRVSPDGDLAMHAKSLAALTAHLTRLFPEGSDFGETEAKEEIWDNWDKFEQAASKAKRATASFAEAVAGGDAGQIAAAHKEVGRACKGCHEDFREKDD